MVNSPCPICQCGAKLLEPSTNAAIGIFHGVRVRVQDFLCPDCGHIGRYIPSPDLELLREHVEGSRRPPPPPEWEEAQPPPHPIQPERDPLRPDRQSLTTAPRPSDPVLDDTAEGPREDDVGPALQTRGGRPIRWYSLDSPLGIAVWLGALLVVLYVLEMILGHTR